MTKINVPGFGPVFHSGSPEEVEKHQRLVNARMEFTMNYCREKGWPVPGEPNFEERISIEQVLEVRAQPGWKFPLGEEDHEENTVILDETGATVVPKGRH